jgi:hypothetical protein
MTSENFDNLLRKIKAEGMDSFSQDQLICISQLVFYSGIGKKEIKDLLVGDVIDRHGNITGSINKFKEAIIITEDSQRALQDYLKAPRDRHLQLLKRKNPLFPGFRNEKKIERAWKVVGTKYSNILDSGIKRHNRTYLSRDMRSGAAVTATAKHFRHSRRSIAAHVTGKTIQPGNFDVIRESLKLLEQADMLKRDDPNLILKTDEIIQKLDEIERKALSPAQKKDIETMRPYIKKALDPFLHRSAANGRVAVPTSIDTDAEILSPDESSEPEH